MRGKLSKKNLIIIGTIVVIALAYIGFISLADSGDVAVSFMDDEGYRIYHVTNEEVLDELVDYIKVHVTKED